MYAEDDYLMISGIQHFLFCRRQWALIHIEHQWEENTLTYDGRAKHTRADTPSLREKRKDKLLVHAMRVHSSELGIYGVCDAVEFTESNDGMRLVGRSKRYRPEIIEYKHGHQKRDLSDTYQLLAETLCLEEMLGGRIDFGSLYYFETNQRVTIEFTEAMRQDLLDRLQEMRRLWKRQYTPKVKTGPWCKRCSLQEICLPALMKESSVAAYIEGRLDE
ncbi:CRISPR-associated protein Cas4 [Lacticaseibacillus daqingensis]|uniref:CRISPR-associated protein Cas4 n=1 Tax=Lacticaseibacillus daqingensis TaxID=2486014 RepID=UPI000F799C8B|nr:CRISPR-associated protein Cas4 [Lacticaseibacillus daqingensis]